MKPFEPHQFANALQEITSGEQWTIDPNKFDPHSACIDANRAVKGLGNQTATKR